jgi:hypothetical protein
VFEIFAYVEPDGATISQLRDIIESVLGKMDVALAARTRLVYLDLSICNNVFGNTEIAEGRLEWDGELLPVIGKDIGITPARISNFSLGFIFARLSIGSERLPFPSPGYSGA